MEIKLSSVSALSTVTTAKGDRVLPLDLWKGTDNSYRQVVYLDGDTKRGTVGSLPEHCLVTI